MEPKCVCVCVLFLRHESTHGSVLFEPHAEAHAMGQTNAHRWAVYYLNNIIRQRNGTYNGTYVYKHMYIYICI
jgi:hypothetical protein